MTWPWRRQPTGRRPTSRVRDREPLRDHPLGPDAAGVAPHKASRPAHPTGPRSASTVAVEKTLAEAKYITPDLGGSASTQDVGAALVERCTNVSIEQSTGKDNHAAYAVRRRVRANLSMTIFLRACGRPRLSTSSMDTGLALSGHAEEGHAIVRRYAEHAASVDEVVVFGTLCVRRRNSLLSSTDWPCMPWTTTTPSYQPTRRASTGY